VTRSRALGTSYLKCAVAILFLSTQNKNPHKIMGVFVCIIVLIQQFSLLRGARDSIIWTDFRVSLRSSGLVR